MLRLSKALCRPSRLHGHSQGSAPCLDVFREHLLHQNVHVWLPRQGPGTLSFPSQVRPRSSAAHRGCSGAGGTAGALACLRAAGAVAWLLPTLNFLTASLTARAKWGGRGESKNLVLLLGHAVPGMVLDAWERLKTCFLRSQNRVILYSERHSSNVHNMKECQNKGSHHYVSRS